MRFVLVVGSTGTARIGGITAAGATPEQAMHTPAADAELVAFGRPVWSPAVPVSPTGCPSPAVVTRAIRELVGFDLLTVTAGLATRTAAPTVTAGTAPGHDIRDPVAVPAVTEVLETGRELGASIPDRELIVGESIPGGTTTALGVLAALGEPYAVSSSCRNNPLERKVTTVDAGLDASDLDRGALAGDPLRAIEVMGDPVLAAVTGLALGRRDTDRPVTLAGGTQMIAVGALLRHFGVEAPIAIATTSFVADDETADLEPAAADLDLTLTVTDPRFDRADHPALERYEHGEAKEGAGMGGALMHASREGVPMSELHEQAISCLDRLSEGDGP